MVWFEVIMIALPLPLLLPSGVYEGGYRWLIVFTSPAAILAPITLVLCQHFQSDRLELS